MSSSLSVVTAPSAVLTLVAVDLDTPAGIVARADRKGARQVLINVVDNTRDALAGGLVVCVELPRGETPA